MEKHTINNKLLGLINVNDENTRPGLTEDNNINRKEALIQNLIFLSGILLYFVFLLFLAGLPISPYHLAIHYPLSLTSALLNKLAGLYFPLIFIEKLVLVLSSLIGSANTYKLYHLHKSLSTETDWDKKIRLAAINTYHKDLYVLATGLLTYFLFLRPMLLSHVFYQIVTAIPTALLYTAQPAAIVLSFTLLMYLCVRYKRLSYLFSPLAIMAFMLTTPYGPAYLILIQTACLIPLATSGAHILTTNNSQLSKQYILFAPVIALLASAVAVLFVLAYPHIGLIFFQTLLTVLGLTVIAGLSMYSNAFSVLLSLVSLTLMLLSCQLPNVYMRYQQQILIFLCMGIFRHFPNKNPENDTNLIIVTYLLLPGLLSFAIPPVLTYQIITAICYGLTTILLTCNPLLGHSTTPLLKNIFFGMVICTASLCAQIVFLYIPPLRFLSPIAKNCAVVSSSLSVLSGATFNLNNYLSPAEETKNTP